MVLLYHCSDVLKCKADLLMNKFLHLDITPNSTINDSSVFKLSHLHNDIRCEYSCSNAVIFPSNLDSTMPNRFPTKDKNKNSDFRCIRLHFLLMSFACHDKGMSLQWFVSKIFLCEPVCW